MIAGEALLQLRVMQSYAGDFAGTVETPHIADVFAAAPKGVFLVPDSDVSGCSKQRVQTLDLLNRSLSAGNALGQARVSTDLTEIRWEAMS
jgi:hypothetical protein